jgi:flavorubredoxin
MGDEILEEDEFEPMFTLVEGSLAGKKIALFGSYGWGDGQWMRDWEERCRNAGITLAIDSVIANEAPDDDAIAACKALGAEIV